MVISQDTLCHYCPSDMVTSQDTLSLVRCQQNPAEIDQAVCLPPFVLLVSHNGEYTSSHSKLVAGFLTTVSVGAEVLDCFFFGLLDGEFFLCVFTGVFPGLFVQCLSWLDLVPVKSRMPGTECSVIADQVARSS